MNHTLSFLFLPDWNGTQGDILLLHSMFFKVSHFHPHNCHFLDVFSFFSPFYVKTLQAIGPANPNSSFENTQTTHILSSPL